jgi:phosphohistidine swiveling domain-containing protein
MQLSAPNFISDQVVRGRCMSLTAYDEVPANMAGAIVLIENADPGFDWIFTHGIGGLVTKYGGANSHMAIRCAEFGVPAAIGCGEQMFDRVLRAHAVEVDCAGGHVRPIGGRS